MILPRTAIHALRAMSALANLAPGSTIRSRELAQRASIPKHYVSKVMRRLVVAGLVDSQRGHNGGFRLALAPDRIPFGAILRAMAVDLETGRCIGRIQACNPAQPCPLHEAWTELQDALARWADGVTLARVRPGSSLHS